MESIIELGAAFDAVALQKVKGPAKAVKDAIGRLHAAEEARVDTRRTDQPVRTSPATGGARPAPSAIR